MDQDLYKILNVKRAATHDEIRTAYRKLAKEFHPDRNPGDKSAEEKFKRISAAFDNAAILAVSEVIRSVRCAICLRSMQQIERARSGMPTPGSSKT